MVVLIKRITKLLLVSLLTLSGMILLYFIAGKCLGSIKIKGKQDNFPKTITCYLKSNGVHTDLVVPVKNKAYDWDLFIDQGHNNVTLNNPEYIAFGWGDKGFYLNTPTWGDLTLKTALKAGFGLSTSAMHVTYYYRMQESSSCVKLQLNELQYKALIKNIQGKFKQRKATLFHINTDQNYGNHDSFYEANGTYSIFYTCNVWVNETLKKSGITTGYWTPFSPEVLSNSK